MSEECVFCRIIKNNDLGSFIYVDETVAAFLDIRPISDGHTLVITKKHYQNIYELPDEETAHLFTVVKKLATAVKSAVKAEGITITQNNEKAAGQVVFHFHVHIIPRYAKRRKYQHRELSELSKLGTIAHKIKQFI